MEDRHNLPLALTSFVGRKKEIRQVRALIVDARLVTLMGVGGSGKWRSSMTVYMVERDLPGITLEQLGGAQRAAITRARRSRRKAKPSDISGVPMCPGRRV